MELTVTLNHGVLNAEFTGEVREEIENELVKFKEFLDENAGLFGDAIPLTSNSGEDVQSAVTQDWSDQSRVTPSKSSCQFSDIADRARVDEATLESFLNMPSDEEKVPYLRLDDFEEEEGILGDTRKDRQARASLVLLYLWQTIREQSEVKSGKLNEALHISQITPTNRQNMYTALNGDADGYFTRSKAGKVGLTQGGELAAVDEITRLAETLESE